MVGKVHRAAPAAQDKNVLPILKLYCVRRIQGRTRTPRCWVRAEIMATKQRKQIRPVEVTSVLDKRFTPVIETRQRITITTVHPLMVVIDLRRGCLTSLERYLRQEGGLPDPEVVAELQKLLSGKSRFMLAVAERGNKGGRPSKGNRKPTRLEFAVADAFEKGKSKGMSASLHSSLADEHGISIDTVKAWIRKVRKYRRQQAEMDALRTRYRTAVKNAAGEQ